MLVNMLRAAAFIRAERRAFCALGQKTVAEGTAFNRPQIEAAIKKQKLHPIAHLYAGPFAHHGGIQAIINPILVY